MQQKVRGVGPRDVKRFEQKGKGLSAAIEDLDRLPMPEIDTRFEAALTARQYHRSSSSLHRDAARAARAPSRRHPTRHPTLILGIPTSEAGFNDFLDSASSILSDYSVAPSPTMDFFSQNFKTDSPFVSPACLPHVLLRTDVVVHDFNGFSFPESPTPLPTSPVPSSTPAPTPRCEHIRHVPR